MKPMKKKLFSILLAAVMVLSLIPAIAISASADPVVYNVSNCEELIEALTAHKTSQDRSETIRLTADIVLDPTAFAACEDRYIYGTFDGQNHKIYNMDNTLLYFIKPDGNCLIENFTVCGKTASDGDDLVITGKTSLFGEYADSHNPEGTTSVIRNVTNERSLTDTNNYNGLFIRKVQIAGTIRFENCTNKGNSLYESDNTYQYGGFVGYMSGGTLEFDSCVNEGNITGSVAGGFVGCYQRSAGKDSTIRMTNCVNKGTITGKNGSKALGIAGGLIGGFSAINTFTDCVSITLDNCSNTGNILVTGSGTKAGAIGGLIGYTGKSAADKTFSLTLNNCSVYNCRIDTNGRNEYAAPLVGKAMPQALDNFTVTANNCYASRVNVIGGSAYKLIGVGSWDDNIESVKIINCVTNKVTDNGSEEWGSNKFEGCVLKVTADAVNKNGFADTDTENVISDGLAPVYQQAAAAADQSKVRFLATLKNVDLNAYSKVGFFVTASFGDPATVKGWNLNGTTVYTSVIAAGETKSASEIYDGHTSETYIFAATIEGISFNESTEVTFYVTPYIINADGSILFGQTGELQNFF